VRLKEHGVDVLVLEKIPANITAPDGSTQIHYKLVLLPPTVITFNATVGDITFSAL